MSTRIEPTPLVINWLRDYNEAPWRRFVRSLEQRGDLVTVDGIMIDAGGLFRTRFRCDSKTCSLPGRESEVESCCQEYDVEITPAERDRIVAHAGDVVEFLAANDPKRVKPGRQIDSFFKERNIIELAKEDGRCAFSYRDSTGQLWCGLHSLALEKGMPLEAIKPIACILFPLVVCRFENGDTLLTSTSSETEQLFDGAKESNKLPCLKLQTADPMFMECRTAIEVAFGDGFYERLAAASDQFLRNPAAQ
jgi:hypothetical protein